MLAAKLLFALLLFSTCVLGNLVGDIIHALQSAVDCGGCHALLVPLQVLAHLGDKAFSDTLIGVCNALHVSPALREETKCSCLVHTVGRIARCLPRRDR